MESIFGQGLDLEESDRGLEAETFDQETTEDDLSKDLELCTEENSQMMEQSIVALPNNSDVLEPYVGMEFKSRDEAREFYVAYGRRTGFTVRIHHNRRSRLNNQVIGQDFVCSKEGFRAKKYVYRKDRVLPPPPVTREGCNAMLRLALRDGVKWIVTKFVKEHSHKLMSPSKVPWRRSERILISEDEKDKKIRELSLELYNEKRRCQRRCAAYQEQLNMILKDVEDHTQHLSRRVQDIVQNIREIEDEESEAPDQR
ncbi:protein FAR-RED ELONGATED HYPOCOTYL 3-like [Telopea speciosissima]|uniref:protein FAR-RED ELONGATED HYPOCOTYL 3-like n=1 Tax=Telopea speciosissima TaxID=54955 RepID=UPI001CC631DA|nr:protein FAR-RED ELONGATED HYPOCOTYL 3-like [Telopea speciosissima]XP_043694004.1 protein FAR-RED ELONGATED HYPOCOTYL 3-like [Telopea speciosissima]